MKFCSCFPSRDTFTREHIARYFCASKYDKGKLVLDIACDLKYGSYFLLPTRRKKLTKIINL